LYRREKMSTSRYTSWSATCLGLGTPEAVALHIRKNSVPLLLALAAVKLILQPSPSSALGFWHIFALKQSTVPSILENPSKAQALKLQAVLPH
jgi:hypothetical protein